MSLDQEIQTIDMCRFPNVTIRVTARENNWGTLAGKEFANPLVTKDYKVDKQNMSKFEFFSVMFSSPIGQENKEEKDVYHIRDTDLSHELFDDLCNIFIYRTKNLPDIMFFADFCRYSGYYTFSNKWQGPVEDSFNIVDRVFNCCKTQLNLTTCVNGLNVFLEAYTKINPDVNICDTAIPDDMCKKVLEGVNTRSLATCPNFKVNMKILRKFMYDYVIIAKLMTTRRPFGLL